MSTVIAKCEYCSKSVDVYIDEDEIRVEPCTDCMYNNYNRGFDEGYRSCIQDNESEK